jgi:hypothetical protein
MIRLRVSGWRWHGSFEPPHSINGVLVEKFDKPCQFIRVNGRGFSLTRKIACRDIGSKGP